MSLDTPRIDNLSVHDDGPREPAQPWDRRRDKRQLSCTFCRRRKVRCDRQLPCNTCVSRGIAMDCTYSPGTTKKGASSVGDRIRELESLVSSLLQQQNAHSPPDISINRPMTETLSWQNTGNDLNWANATADMNALGNLHVQQLMQEHVQPTPAVPAVTAVPAAPGTQPRDMGSPTTHKSASELASIRGSPRSTKYVDSSHWASVLDGISQLKNQYEMEEEERRAAADDEAVEEQSPGPSLLYQPVYVSRADILASLPERSLVDRLVARYFNEKNPLLLVLHSNQFQREYESFWQNPDDVSIHWIGLLFSVICITLRSMQASENLDGFDNQHLMSLFHERAAQCLILGKYTNGGKYALETLLHHCVNEVFLHTDTERGIWFLVGDIVQLAVSLGYHRDPSCFPNISPFDGEMRRRVWAAVMQFDFRLSVRMGLPRLIKNQDYDTTEPRNIFDEDFSMESLEIPPSRPETEVTPMLFNLARSRIDNTSRQVLDLVSGGEEPSYHEILEMNQKLQKANADLPRVFQWQPLHQSFATSPRILLARIWLQLAIHRLVIWLHRKYLSRSYSHAEYGHSRSACVTAAMKTLELQQILDQEMQPAGRLYSVKHTQSPLIQSPMLLAVSVLCYYLELAKTAPDIPVDSALDAKIESLLRTTYPTWLQSSNVSRDAQEATHHLSLALGLQARQGDDAAAPINNFYMEQEAWDAYRGTISDAIRRNTSLLTLTDLE